MTMSSLTVIAVAFGAVALVLFALMLRNTSAVAMTSEGVIVSKTFKPASTYTQIPAGANRGMRAPTEIPIAESYVVEVRVEGLDQRVFYDLNIVASRSFDVGQRVRISYRKRGIPFATKKYMVLDMQTLDVVETTRPPTSR